MGISSHETSVNIATVSAKGWIVIPAGIRRKYRIEPGRKIQIVDYGGVLGLVPALENPIREARGTLAGKTSLTRALLEERRREKTREGRSLRPPR